MEKGTQTAILLYSDKDINLARQFSNHLRVLELNGLLLVRSYAVGNTTSKELETEINDYIKQCTIGIALISNDFIGTDTLYKIFFRQVFSMHTKNLLKLFPVLLRYCNWEMTPIAHLRILPENKIPVTDKQWSSEDKPFKHVIDRILQQIDPMHNANQTIQENESKYIEPKEDIQFNAPKKVKTHKTSNTKASIDEFRYKYFILEAQNFKRTQQWRKAIDEFQKALQHYKVGFMPDKSELLDSIELCNNQLQLNSTIVELIEAVEKTNSEKVLQILEIAQQVSPNLDMQQFASSYREHIDRKNFGSRKSESKPLKIDISGFFHRLTSKSLIIILSISLVFSSLVWVAVAGSNNSKLEKVIKESEKYRAMNAYENETTHNEYIKQLISLIETDDLDTEDSERVKLILNEMNSMYIDNLLESSNTLIRKGQYEEAIKSLSEANLQYLSDKLKAKLDNLISDMIHDYYSDFEDLALDYVRINQFNFRQHKELSSKILFFYQYKDYLRNTESFLNKEQSINDLYIDYYIQSVNTQVARYEFKKALETLSQVHDAIAHPTAEQQQKIKAKINDVNQLFRLMKNFQ